jgi:hypothetical protein
MIDYKNQYLKYKFKYLAAKSKENFTGGGLELTSFTGLSIAALIAGIIYFIYNKKFTNANTCMHELEKKDSENINNHKSKIKLIIKEVSNKDLLDKSNNLNNINSNQIYTDEARMMTDEERREFEAMHEVYEALLNAENNKPDKKKTPE